MLAKDNLINAVIGLLILFTLYIICVIVFCDGGTDDGTRRQLEVAGEEQQRAVRYIEQSTGEIDQAERRVKDAIEEAERLSDRLTECQAELVDGEKLLADSKRRIEICKRIVKEVRKQTTAN